MRLAERIVNMPPYFFVGVNRRIAEMQAQGIRVINLSMGNPDLPPPDFIVEALYKAAQNPSYHGYAGYYGIPTFRQAVAGWYEKRFGVKLDWDKEVVALIGSKEAIANISLAVVDAGDVVLVADPGYPTYHTCTLMAGGEPYPVPLQEESGFLPDLKAIPEDVARRAKMMWLNYPNNPTGAVAPLAFFEEVVEFARRYNLAIVHDNPYCDVCFDGYVAPSFLNAPGAKEVGVEINSLSKTYNMAGWRIGMAVGNSELIGALAQVKSNIDTGIFRPIQEAGVVALQGDQGWLKERNEIYRRRRDIIWEGLRSCGLKVEKPKAGLYLWAEVPAGWKAAEFADRILDQTAVYLTPGVVYGQNGEGYLRIAITSPEEELREAAERIAKLRLE